MTLITKMRILKESLFAEEGRMGTGWWGWGTRKAGQMQREPDREAEAPKSDFAALQCKHICQLSQSPIYVDQYLSCLSVPKCSQYRSVAKERVPSLAYYLALRSRLCPRWALHLHRGHGLTHPPHCSSQTGAIPHCHHCWCACALHWPRWAPTSQGVAMSVI